MLKRSLILITCLMTGIAHTQAATLVEVYQLAQDHDPTLQTAYHQYRASLQSVPQALAKFGPVVNLTGDTTGISTEIPSIGNYNTHKYTFNLNLPIFRRENFSTFSQAQHIECQAKATYEKAVQDLILRVCERFFAVLASGDAVYFSKAQRKAFARQLEQTQQRFDVGLIAITDVHEAQARHDNAVAQVIAAQNDLADRYEQLRELTGQPIDTLTPLTANDTQLLIPPHPNQLEDWVSTANHRNFDIQISKHSVAIAQKEITNQAAGHWPSVSLSSSWEKRQDASLAPPFNGSLTTKTVSLNLNVPLVESGGVIFRTKEAKANYRAEKSNLDLTRRTVESTTRQAYRGILTQISQVKALAQAVRSNSSALSATQAAYEVGTRTIVDVLDAESNLLNAQNQHSGARYDYILEGLRLKQAAGILNEKDILGIDQLLSPKKE